MTTPEKPAMPEPVGHLHSSGDFCQTRQLPDVRDWPVVLYSRKDVAALIAERDALAADARRYRHRLELSFSSAIKNGCDDDRDRWYAMLRARHDAAIDAAQGGGNG